MYDGELDTARDTYWREAHKNGAYERALKGNPVVEIFTALTEPYAHDEPVEVALPLFKQWKDICAQKGLLPRGEFHSAYLFDLLATPNPNPVAWHVLALVRASGSFAHNTVIKDVFSAMFSYKWAQESHKSSPIPRHA